MAADGGTSAYSTNTAGPKYGTGYCDSQCPSDLKFITGVVRALPLVCMYAARQGGLLLTCVISV